MDFSASGLIKEIEVFMSKTIEHAVKELSGIRTGKASPNLVNDIQVAAYGGISRLKDIAGVSAPEPRLLVIQPWDPSILDEIIKAIAKANIGITPLKDGKIVRMPIPELSDERRSEMTKIAKKIAEENKVAIRNIRRDYNEKIKKMQKSSEITEDVRHDVEADIQKLTDKYISNIDSSLQAKEKELDSM